MSRRSSTGYLPLFAWGEALRRTRRKHRCRRDLLIVTAGCAALLIAPLLLRSAPRLVWNATASAPIGLYHVVPGGISHTGDMVIADLPDAIGRVAADRQYLPLGVPLVKRVVAVTGDAVCARGAAILVNAKQIAIRRVRDARGRPMAWWRGCGILRGGAVLLLMVDKSDSFDGRYFGPTPSRDLVGKANLLWPR